MNYFWLLFTFFFSYSDTYCFLICPGIGSSSESAYVRSMVDVAQRNGYTSAVLNHLGSLKDVRLTCPRMFTYGKLKHFNFETFTLYGSFVYLLHILFRKQVSWTSPMESPWNAQKGCTPHSHYVQYNQWHRGSDYTATLHATIK